MIHEPRPDKTNKMSVRPAKTQIRLGGCPGWSESSLGAQSLCWFCHVAAHLISWARLWSVIKLVCTVQELSAIFANAFFRIWTSANPRPLANGILKWFKKLIEYRLCFFFFFFFFFFFQVEYLLYENIHSVSVFHQSLLWTNFSGLNESQNPLWRFEKGA